MDLDSNLFVKRGDPSKQAHMTTTQFVGFTTGQVPAHVIVPVKWSQDLAESRANILGPTHTVVCPEPTINLPVIAATADNLKSYGALLCRSHKQAPLPPNMPLFHVSIGANYVQEYLMNLDGGGGEDLEYHSTPHYHQPISTANSPDGGFLILGRRLKSYVMLTGYTIPAGYGVYTPAWCLHSDAHLIGHYLVAYTITPNYTTAILKTSQDIPVSLKRSKK